MNPDRPAEPFNVHIIGLAGSGKTTLARWLAGTFALEAYDLDPIAFDHRGERPLAEVERSIEEICRTDGWVTEGAYQQQWIEPLLARADVIVWLDVPLRACIVRMVKRHIRAELTRTNQHPGWMKLLRFLNYTRRSSARQRRRTQELLSGYRSKLHRCRTSREIVSFKRSMMRTYRR